MKNEFPNKVNLRGFLFWKSFLRVFILFQIVKLSSFLIVSILLNDNSNGHFLEALFDLVFGLFELILAFACSFIVTYFVSKRLISDNPESIFGYGLLKLFLVFFLMPLPLTIFAFAIAEGFFIDLELFIFWISTDISILLWLYFSSLWLYKFYKKKNLLQNSL